MTSEEFRNDPMFLRNQFAGDNKYGMLLIKRAIIPLANMALIGYDKLSEGEEYKVVHFFLDDYKFEAIWKDPEPRIERLAQYRAVLSPQFSTYYTMPQAMQVYNMFRSRWCGAYLQSKGITVIPTVSWGQPESYDYCFEGIERGSIVAVSTLGVKREKEFFLNGYNEMMRRLSPAAVICYSEPYPEMTGNIIAIDYAETNNLARPSKVLSQTNESGDNSCYIFGKASRFDDVNPFLISPGGYMVETGMGSGGGGSGGNSRGNPKTLDDHFNRHGIDFGSSTKEGYANQANNFFHERNKYQVKVDSDGTIRVYDSKTNTFGSYNSDGSTRTFFKPSGGQNYFDRQPGN